MTLKEERYEFDEIKSVKFIKVGWEYILQVNNLFLFYLGISWIYEFV